MLRALLQARRQRQHHFGLRLFTVCGVPAIGFTAAYLAVRRKRRREKEEALAELHLGKRQPPSNSASPDALSQRIPESQRLSFFRRLARATAKEDDKDPTLASSSSGPTRDELMGMSAVDQRAAELASKLALEDAANARASEALSGPPRNTTEGRERLRTWEQRRVEWFSRAKGDVLEVGCGPGRNFGSYALAAAGGSRHSAEDDTLQGPEPLRSLTLSDKVSEMFRLAEARAARHTKLTTNLSKPVKVVEASAEALPFGDDTFDTVTISEGLCSFEDPHKALDEVHRVLRKGAEKRSGEETPTAEENRTERDDLAHPRGPQLLLLEHTHRHRDSSCFSAHEKEICAVVEKAQERACDRREILRGHTDYKKHSALARRTEWFWSEAVLEYIVEPPQILFREFVLTYLPTALALEFSTELSPLPTEHAQQNGSYNDRNIFEILHDSGIWRIEEVVRGGFHGPPTATFDNQIFYLIRAVPV